jgi:predicted Zn-dependent protease
VPPDLRQRLRVTVWVGLLALIAVIPTVASAQPKGNPAMPCYQALADDPRFAPIREKVVLGPATRSETQRVAQIAERSSEREKPAIAAWRAAREQCHQQEKPYLETRDTQIQETVYRYFAAVQALIGELEAGRVTYGEFGKRRMDLYDKLDRDVENIRKSILPSKPIPHTVGQ